MNKILKDTLVCGAICLIAVIAYWDSLGLPPPQYDPLGAGTLPRIVAVAIICLCVVVVGQSALEHFRASARPAGSTAREFVLRPGLAATVFGIAFLFAISLKVQVPYWIACMLFLFVTILTMSRFRRSAVLPSAAVAAVIGLVVTVLFESVFNVDLP